MEENEPQVFDAPKMAVILEPSEQRYVLGAFVDGNFVAFAQAKVGNEETWNNNEVVALSKNAPAASESK